MRPLLLVVSVALAAAACGRLGFDAGDAGGDGAIAAENVRWAKTFAATTSSRVYGGEPDGAGGAVLALPFQGAFDFEGMVLTSTLGATSSVLTRLDAEGRVAWYQALHAGAECDLRAADFGPADAVLAGGLTQGNTVGATPCDAGVGAVQDPMLLAYTASGAYAGRATYDATGTNGQLWDLEPYADGTAAVLGIYGGGLTINGVTLPNAPGCCDATFVARVGGATTWQVGLSGSMRVQPVALDVAANQDLCVVGWFDAPVTLFGVAVDTVGAADIWVARLAPDGSARFVRTFGSIGDDQTATFTDRGGVAATADGGCVVQAVVRGGVDLGGSIGLMPYEGGSDVLFVKLDAAGAATTAAAVGSGGDELASGLAIADGTAYTTIGVDRPITIAGTAIEPAGIDLVVIALDPTGPTAVLAQIGGTGDVASHGMAARGSELLVYGTFKGELRAGTTTATAAVDAAFAIDLTLR